MLCKCSFRLQRFRGFSFLMTVAPCGLDKKRALVTNSVKQENKTPHESMLENYLIMAHNKILQFNTVYFLKLSSLSSKQW